MSKEFTFVVTKRSPRSRSKRQSGAGYVAAGSAGSADSAGVTAHSHAVSDIANLQSALDAKSDVGHGHAIDDVNGLTTTLGLKADLVHNHGLDIRQPLDSGDPVGCALEYDTAYQLMAGGSTFIFKMPAEPEIPITSDTWRPILVNGDAFLAGSIVSNRLNIVAGDDIALSTQDPGSGVSSVIISSALTFATFGSGNAVTSVSKIGSEVTFVKGATYLTSHQDISGKADVSDTGCSLVASGRTVTLRNKNGAVLSTIQTQDTNDFSRLSGTVTNAQLAGGIANDKLSHSSIMIAGTSVSLGGSITAAAIGGALTSSAPAGYATDAGTSAACSGNSATATRLSSSRTIWGQSFDGSANVSGALTDVTTITASGNITTGGKFYDSSDARLKDVHGALDMDLEDILRIPKVVYSWKCRKERLIGTIAQDIMTMLPEVVIEDENGYYAVDYDALSIVALKGIELLNKRINQLTGRYGK